MPSRFRFTAYTPDDAPRWNALAAANPNATFLFDRGFMDYHADRFTDASLLIWREDRLVALLPAHRDGERLVSHGGLSYGGVLVAQPLGAEAMLALMQALQQHLAGQGVQTLVYKTVPHIYHRLPCEDDLYALFRCGATLKRRDVMSAIGPTPAQWPASRRRPVTGAMRARADFELRRHAGCSAETQADWAAFWAVLSAELQARHQSAPVHSLAEISALAAAFPEQIELHLAQRPGAVGEPPEVLAGLVLFEAATVSHVQYMAASPAARRCAALDLLAERAIAQAQGRGKWFDFGHSNEDQGRVLNTGLAFYKESHGASAVVHDYYELPCRLAGQAPLPE
jgi:Acetyltransferase (GNAT) domain